MNGYKGKILRPKTPPPTPPKAQGSKLTEGSMRASGSNKYKPSPAPTKPPSGPTTSMKAYPKDLDRKIAAAREDLIKACEKKLKKTYPKECVKKMGFGLKSGNYKQKDGSIVKVMSMSAPIIDFPRLQYNDYWDNNTKYQVRIAYKLALTGHEQQFRRDGITPYVSHPIHVANKFSVTAPKEANYAAKLVIVALLHDVIEDTKITIRDLSMAGIPADCISAIVRLTHQPNQTYLNYILKIKTNKLAAEVKLADIAHNSLTATATAKEKYDLASYILRYC